MKNVDVTETEEDLQMAKKREEERIARVSKGKGASEAESGKGKESTGLEDAGAETDEGDKDAPSGNLAMVAASEASADVKCRAPDVKLNTQKNQGGKK